MFRSLQTRSFGREHEITADMSTEFHRDADRPDQIDQGDGIEFDVPQIHYPQHITSDPTDIVRQENECSDDIKAQQNKCHYVDGRGRIGKIRKGILPDGEILFIEDVEDATNGSHRPLLPLSVFPPAYLYGNTSRSWPALHSISVMLSVRL